MSLSKKRIHDKDYLYLQAGRSKTLLLGSADATDPSQFKTENVREGLDYVRERAGNYLEIYFKLLEMLPEGARDQYRLKLWESLPKEERRRLPRTLQERLVVVVSQIRVTLSQLKLSVQPKEPHEPTLRNLTGLESDSKKIASAIDELDGELETLVALAHQPKKRV